MRHALMDMVCVHAWWQDLKRLDDVQRLSILSAVAAGKLGMNEAMNLVEEVRAHSH